jgi:hypothetical protein
MQMEGRNEVDVAYSQPAFMLRLRASDTKDHLLASQLYNEKKRRTMTGHYWAVVVNEGPRQGEYGDRVTSHAHCAQDYSKDLKQTGIISPKYPKYGETMTKVRDCVSLKVLANPFCLTKVSDPRGDATGC